MYRVFSCLFVEHDPFYIAAAVTVCVIGSVLALRLLTRVFRAFGPEKLMWLFIAGFIGGSTVWTTHFLAMLGYQGAGVAGYEPVVTLLSLAISIVSMTLGFAAAAYSGRTLLLEAGGVIIGLGIAAMHYVGMSAYQLQGGIEWQTSYVVASLAFTILFGVLAMNRIGRPCSRHCRRGAMAALVLAIASAHFIGMAAINLVPDLSVAIPQAVVEPLTLGIGVMILMFLLLALGTSTYLIDASTMRAAVERYRHLSLYDALTGLPNRTAFNEELAGIFARRDGSSGQMAILSFDLDRFKEVNDVHGHGAGDAVLRRIGERLSRIIGEGEFLARVGGDEFIALMRNSYSRADVSRLAGRLISEISAPIEWNGNSLTVGTSVGIAILADQATRPDELLAQADVAMYRAKSSGTNAICFYDASMDRAARERNALAMDMRAGLPGGQFELFYQRQNDTFTGEVVGFEVLLRWNHPERGLVMPSDFIPIAERSGLIIDLGDWVLQEACREAASWKKPLGIAVNVAAQQLADPNFPSRVQQALEATGLDPARLELEITETGIIADHQQALQAIRHLKSLGVRIAMDDYGSGYSSLSMLLTFPFDKIKIDRQFVDGVASSAQSAAIVRSTLILASSLNIPVLAEGVETEDHMRFLREEGCLQVQGFLFGRPGPRAGIEGIVNGFSGEAPFDKIALRA